ncbi:hypothetical protein E2562_020599 [Oryza meyeriana var. granulata]|uniref:Uncharacterized protein n=1 Tax=Oryza meyeriana var. granulata TaxID=110450 RepID=A0A6G1DYE3_9ORYZ|nr:hypothetical protein E2562_020599 [Oryza meyeriana var. granulata]
MSSFGGSNPSATSISNLAFEEIEVCHSPVGNGVDSEDDISGYRASGTVHPGISSPYDGGKRWRNLAPRKFSTTCGATAQDDENGVPTVRE